MANKYGIWLLKSVEKALGIDRISVKGLRRKPINKDMEMVKISMEYLQLTHTQTSKDSKCN